MRSLNAFTSPPFAELGRAYSKGRLTPFIGAGLSRDNCPGWEEMISDLERAAFGETPKTEPVDEAP